MRLSLALFDREALKYTFSGTIATKEAHLVSLHYLVTGETASARKLYGKTNLLAREEALYMHTIGSTWFSSKETVKGRIEPGQLADFVILSKVYFHVPDDQIKTIRSPLTVINGEVAYGEGDYANLSPTLPPILPIWSPIKITGPIGAGTVRNTESDGYNFEERRDD